MLKIISWNILQGGGTRVRKIVSQLTELNPDIIVLSEFRNNASGINLRYSLLKAGYRFQNVSSAPGNDNSVAILSKLACDQFLYPKSDEVYPHNIVASDYEAFTLYGMYLPHKKKHRLFDFLLEQIQSTKPAVLVGDFNSGKNYIDQKGNSFWYEDKLLALEKLGYLDAFRLKHGDVKEYSWFSHQGNGYRYDHTYVHESLKAIVKACYYLHDWRENGLSDHSPMLLELG